MPLKTYTVIPHSCPSGLALRRQPEIVVGNKIWYKGFICTIDKVHPNGLIKFYTDGAAFVYDKISVNDVQSAENAIPIAIEYKKHWKKGDSVSENEFITEYCNCSCADECQRDRLNTGFGYRCKLAIPKAKEEEEESGWMSVKNKLPEYYRKVIVSFPDPSDLENETIEDYGSLTRDGWVSHLFKKPKVTHWQPAPLKPNTNNT